MVSEGEHFCLLELVEIRLYLGASLCISFLDFDVFFVRLFMIGGDTFIVSYVSGFTAY